MRRLVRTSRFSLRRSIFVLAILVSSTLRAEAAEIEGVTFSDSYQAGSITMPLLGVGLAKFLLAIKVYVAALYLGQGTKPEQALQDVPKRLEISYFRSIKAADITRASEKNLSDNVSQDAIAALRLRLDRLHRLYEDVKPGDRYALTYLPGVGTELALNGHRKGVVEGADFAAAYFAIWLGPDPINDALKDGLMNRR
ncbi:MAG: chalcone isomerase family protein [Nitrospiraceae bacterium]